MSKVLKDYIVNRKHHQFRKDYEALQSFRIFKDEESVKKVAALVKAYIDMGGHQLQLNAVNSEMLKAAQENPEEHRQQYRV